MKEKKIPAFGSTGCFPVSKESMIKILERMIEAIENDDDENLSLIIDSGNVNGVEFYKAHIQWKNFGN